jgi:hypothetical protein
MKIDWYTKRSHLKQWQAIAETLKQGVSIQWRDLGGETCDRTDSGARSCPEEEAEVCVVAGIESEAAEVVASVGQNARVRVAILGAVELNEVLFARDPESIEALRDTPPLIDRLGGLLERFDGVITVIEDQAEVIRQHLLTPVKVVRIPHLLEFNQEVNEPLNFNKQDFADSFIEFLQEVHQWQPLMRLCDRVGEEIAYLGVDEEMPVIGVVSKHVSALLPRV